MRSVEARQVDMRSATALTHRVRPGSERARRRIFAAGAQDWSYRDGPGAGRSAVPAMKRSRRAADPSQFKRGRPSSVSLSLAAIGDKWTVLVIGEAFLGVRRFDRLLSELMIAPLFSRIRKTVAASNMRYRLKYHPRDCEADRSHSRAAPGRI